MALFFKAILCIAVLEALGGLGAFITRDQISNWYQELSKPPGNPPNWIFGPMWTLLYAMMGVALARIWHLVPSGAPKKMALGWFSLQLLLNLAWTPVFFGLHHLTAALIVILALNITIWITIRRFRPLDAVSANLLVPYAFWVAYATYLNGAHAWLNR